MFCTFWLGHVLPATTACTFSTPERLKVVRTCGVLYFFWLGNVLRATTACTFSTSQLLKVFRSWSALYILTWKCASTTTAATFPTSQLPKVVRTWCALCILTCKCASRHNGVQLFISHLARWLRTRCFSKPIFRPPRATNHWKTQWIATFRPFRAPASSFFSDLLTSFLLLSDSSHLCFSHCLYCRKFHF